MAKCEQVHSPSLTDLEERLQGLLVCYDTIRRRRHIICARAGEEADQETLAEAEDGIEPIGAEIAEAMP